MEIVRSAPSFESLGPISIDELLSAKRRILICDTDESSHSAVSDCLAGEGYEIVFVRTSVEAAQEMMSARESLGSEFDLLVWGLSSPFESGFETGLEELREIREISRELKVILLAPQEALAFAPQIKLANVDAFIMKPLHPNDIKGGIERALKKSGITPRVPQASVKEPARVRSPEGDGRELGLIGDSEEMQKVIGVVRKVGRSSVNVLITGESGTGKEMVAQAIHKVSDRAKKPFIAINCAAIPRELLESELFGHAKGAFTGATTARRGLFEEAHEGTLLLDEIGDLPMSLQAKILRVLQTRQVKPVGQNTVKEVDVRIVSATHKNLKSLIHKGEFREDLYYRLNVMPIHLPPLRERKEDILLLAEYFLKRYAEAGRGPLRGLTRKASTKLQNMPWKGNVRELENVIERAIVLAENDLISDEEIMCEESEPVRATAEDLFNAGLSLRDIEREYIKYVLTRTGNKKETATRILGIDRKTLYRKEKLYGIRPTGPGGEQFTD